MSRLKQLVELAKRRDYINSIDAYHTWRRERLAKSKMRKMIPRIPLLTAWRKKLELKRIEQEIRLLQNDGQLYPYDKNVYFSA